MNEHRYILETGSKKHPCPECGQKRFVRYIDTHTGEHLPEQYGRCDREVNCAYHLNPYTDEYTKMIWEKEQGHRGNSQNKDSYKGNWKPRSQKQNPKPAPKPISFIPVEVFKQSRKGYGQNYFVQWLTKLFGIETTNELVSRYHIGTSKHREGANVFWQIDVQGRVRSGKIMLYDPATGKRVKSCTTWAHAVKKLPEFNLQQCLFGEHLLNGNTNGNDRRPVALVESEKTSIVASVYLPRFLWLAVGGKSSLNIERCKVLAGRDVYLFPDLNAYEDWNTKAKELTQRIPRTRFVTSDLLEKNATETDRAKGLDIADFLIKHDCREFSPMVGQSRSESNNLSNENLAKLNIEKGRNLIKPNIEKTKSWTVDINELETFFARATLPAHPVKLNEYSTIADVSKFIHGHIKTVKANYNKATFLPYFDRLQDLKQVLTINTN